MMAAFEDVRVKAVGACFLCGLLGFAAGNGHTTTGAVAHVSEQLGQQNVALAKTRTALKQSDCDKNRIVGIAAQGILAGEQASVPAPGWEDLSGCPTVRPVLPQQVAPK